MDSDMHVKDAFDNTQGIVSTVDLHALSPSRAAGIIKTLREIDEVLRVIF